MVTKANQARVLAILAAIGGAAMVTGALLPWTTGEREFIELGSKPSFQLCGIQGSPGSDEHLECLDDVRERRREYEDRLARQRAAFDATFEVSGRRSLRGQVVLISGLLSLEAALALVFIGASRFHGVLAALVALAGLTGMNVAAFVVLTFQETDGNDIGTGLYISIAGGAVAFIAAILSTSNAIHSRV